MRDEFSARTKTTLAGRAGYTCSNPACRLPTSGAALGQESKIVNVGIAAHIKGASPEGPRYDISQSSEERRSLSNGIWLCTVHAKQIDDDPDSFTVDVLKRWKEAAEYRSAHAVLTLKKIDDFFQVSNFVESDFARKIGFDEVNIQEMFSRLKRCAARDLIAFNSAKRVLNSSILLNLRLINGEDVTPFQAPGLAEAIGIFNEIVVIAGPGTGKTTTLLQIAKSISASANFLAAYIPLSEWSVQESTLFQSILSRAAYAGESEVHLKILADTGQLIFVMDG